MIKLGIIFFFFLIHMGVIRCGILQLSGNTAAIRFNDVELTQDDAQRLKSSSLPKISVDDFVCNAETEGQWMYDPDTKSYFGCDGTEILSISKPASGESSSSAVSGCDDEALKGSPSGTYWVCPSAPFQAYCDLDRDNGGWMRVLEYKNNAYTPTTAASGTISDSTISGFAKLSDEQINCGHDGATKRVFKFEGSKTSHNFYVITSSKFQDTARAHNLPQGGFIACVSASIASASCSGHHAPSTYLDSYGQAPNVANDERRYFVDHDNNPQCYNPRDNSRRCWSCGASCSQYMRIDDLVVWVSSASYHNR